MVPIPVARKIVGSKWVFKLKQDADGNVNRHKASLVAQEFSQQLGLDFDDLYAPVVRYDLLRMLIVLAAYHNWWPQQLDIKAAFLYNNLEKDIHMQLPEGSRIESMCAKLNKCIYRLKQSPSAWYHHLTDYLVLYGFTILTFNL